MDGGDRRCDGTGCGRFSRAGGADGPSSVDDDRIVIVAGIRRRGGGEFDRARFVAMATGQPAVLRHFLKVADDGVEVVRIAGLNDYQVDIGAAGLAGAGEQDGTGVLTLASSRCSRRWMCRGNVRVSPVWPRGSGTVLGWQVLQLPGSEPACRTARRCHRAPGRGPTAVRGGRPLGWTIVSETTHTWPQILGRVTDGIDLTADEAAGR